MSTHEHNDTARDAAFDAAVRSAHAASLDHLSPRVRARLVQRRRTALAGNARQAWHPLRFAWPVAAALAVGALAIGWQLRAPTTPVPAPRTLATTAPTDAATAYDTLDESPDLYVWLASDDAVAME